jgi:uncharacterized protein (DUF3084 family)
MGKNANALLVSVSGCQESIKVLYHDNLAWKNAYSSELQKGEFYFRMNQDLREYIDYLAVRLQDLNASNQSLQNEIEQLQQANMYKDVKLQDVKSQVSTRTEKSLFLLTQD